MPAFYNEIDPYAAQWLRNLIAAELIAPGDVDERSIVDVRPGDLEGYTQCHFFAGIGGWSFAARLAGWPDTRPIWTGSCPCQPFSLAGKRTGFDDARHLWPVFANLIRERDPAVVFGEQVASATDWLGLVRSDLEAMGRAVGAIPVEAASAGADHLRDRYWFVADRAGKQVGAAGQPRQCGDVVDTPSIGRREGRTEHEVRSGRPTASFPSRAFGVDVADPGSDGAGRIPGDRPGSEGTVDRQHWRASRSSFAARFDGAYAWVIGADGKARRVKPGVRLLAHGVPNRVAKLRAFGNAIDPRPAAQFIAAYLEAA